MAYSVWIAGTTTRTVSCALALLKDPRFEIHLIITPTPKPVGREQQITPNPLHQFATEHQLPVELVQRKIDQQLQEKLQAHARPDFLLVVDFGYIVPQWLLDLPIIAPLNVHPSTLHAVNEDSQFPTLPNTVHYHDCHIPRRQVSSAFRSIFQRDPDRLNHLS